MERAGLTPQVAADMSDLADLVNTPGPFLSVQLTTEADIDNAAHRSEQRWRALRDNAAAQGAPEEALAAVDPLVPDAHLQGRGLVVVATGAGAVHVEHGRLASRIATSPGGPPCPPWGRWWPGARRPPAT